MGQNSISISDFKRSLLNDLSKIFQGNEAYSISRLILEHYGYSEFSILKDPSQLINYKIRSEITKIVNELSNNRPIQYILGETIFFELKFHVNESVLIPRPETEELVSNILLDNIHPGPKVLDIGCGSGCICVSLAHNIPGSKVTAIDIDRNTLETAKRNASENKVIIEFFADSIFNPEKLPKDDLYDLIVSNPPYVTLEDRQLMSPNVTNFEPELALFVPDNDPLIFYREIAKFSKSRLSDNGAIWVEINERFGNETKTLFHDSGFTNVRLIKDIHNKDRFIKAMK